MRSVQSLLFANLGEDLSWAHWITPFIESKSIEKTIFIISLEKWEKKTLLKAAKNLFRLQSSCTIKTCKPHQAYCPLANNSFNLRCVTFLQSTRGSMPTVKSVFQVNFGFTNEIITPHQIPIIHTNSQHGVHWNDRLEFKAPNNTNIANQIPFVFYMESEAIVKRKFDT